MLHPHFSSNGFSCNKGVVGFIGCVDSLIVSPKFIYVSSTNPLSHLISSSHFFKSLLTCALTSFFTGSVTTGKWTIGWQSYQSECDEFGKCGNFGRCNKMNSPICDCLDGFEPKNKEEWKNGDWSNGCVRIRALQCGNLMGGMDGFLRLEHMKVPDNAQWLTAQDKNDCRRKCFKVCSCLAYAYYFGIGCMVWNESLIDIQQYPYAGADLYIRLADSELGKCSNHVFLS